MTFSARNIVPSWNDGIKYRIFVVPLENDVQVISEMKKV
jgi:hypothetical protein